MAIPAARTLVKIDDTRGSELTDQGHRLPVEVAVRLRRRRRLVLLHARRRPATRPASSTRASTRRHGRRTTCSTSTTRWSCRVGTKVRVLLTAADVIHAWWVPDFGMKKDAIPGYVNELWFKADEGRHLPRPVRRALRPRPRLHADRGRASVEQAEYDSWLASQKAARAGRRSARRRRPRRRRPNANETTTLQVANAE